MKKPTRNALVQLVISVLVCIPSQGCKSADGNANGQSDVTAGAKREFIANDPDWEVNITSAVPQPDQYSVSCSSTADCWFWNGSSLWSYDKQQPQVKRISVQLNQNERILNAFLLSSDVGWIVTNLGLLKTSDSGANWAKVDVSQLDRGKGRVHAVYFANETQGWVAGGRYQLPLKGEALPNNAVSDDRKQILVGAVLKTDDGGLRWQDTYLQRSIGRFNEVTFTGNVGMISGDAGLEVSTNGGANWINCLSDYPRDETGEKPEVIGAFFFDDRRGWASLSGAELIATDDGARSWHVIYTSGPSELDALSFNKLVFVNERRGLGLHTKLGRGQLYKTNNAGKTWSPILPDESFSGFGRVPGSSLVIAVGKRGVYSITPR